MRPASAGSLGGADRIWSALVAEEELSARRLRAGDPAQAQGLAAAVDLDLGPGRPAKRWGGALDAAGVVLLALAGVDLHRRDRRELAVK